MASSRELSKGVWGRVSPVETALIYVVSMAASTNSIIHKSIHCEIIFWYIYIRMSNIRTAPVYASNTAVWEYSTVQHSWLLHEQIWGILSCLLEITAIPGVLALCGIFSQHFPRNVHKHSRQLIKRSDVPMSLIFVCLILVALTLSTIRTHDPSSRAGLLPELNAKRNALQSHLFMKWEYNSRNFLRIIFCCKVPAMFYISRLYWNSKLYYSSKLIFCLCCFLCFRTVYQLTQSCAINILNGTGFCPCSPDSHSLLCHEAERSHNLDFTAG